MASASPRRRDLLKASGFEALCQPADVEEIAEGLSPRELVQANAELKVRAVAPMFPDDLILGADTVVVLENEILGKPRDLPHAAEMLERLSGRMHEVLTGFCLYREGAPSPSLFVESSRVFFRPLDRELIDRYLNEINPLDKAGSYAAQEDHGRLIERIEGSLDNVIGLPVKRVIAEIETLEKHVGIKRLNGVAE